MNLEETIQELRDVIVELDKKTELDSIDLENLCNELNDIVGYFTSLPNLTALTDVVTSLAATVRIVDDRLQNIETMVELVKEHAEPVIAEVMSSPMFRMLTGGKR